MGVLGQARRRCCSRSRSIYYSRSRCVLIAALALAGIAGWPGAGYSHLHPVGWALLGVGAVVYLAMPRVLFATHLADQRLPIALVFMLIACIDTRSAAASRCVRAFAALFVVLLAVRLGEVQIVWNELARGPVGFRVRQVRSIAARACWWCMATAPLRRPAPSATSACCTRPSLATIERSALVSTNFAVPGKHILQVREPYRAIRRHRGPRPAVGRLAPLASRPADGRRFYWSQWPHHFDYVYVLFTTPGSAQSGSGAPDAGR